MKTLNIALVTFALATTFATSAFAHTEFRDSDSVQGATASFSQEVSATSIAPTALLSDAENINILHNVRKDLN